MVPGGFGGEKYFENGFEFLRAPEVATTDDDGGDSVAVWLCGSVALWHCGSVGVWHCGIVALWQCGSMAFWHCGSVAVWQCGIVAVQLKKFREFPQRRGLILSCSIFETTGQ